MKQQLPDLYMINSDETEQKIEMHKLRLEFPDGVKVTIEMNNQNPQQVQEIVLRAYHGNEEYDLAATEKFVRLNLRPGACNLVAIRPESFSRKVISETGRDLEANSQADVSP